MSKITGEQNGVQVESQAGQSNKIRARNYTDQDGNPSGGYAQGPGMTVVFQDGPRGKIGESLAPANGAFVEDLMVAAMQRLSFFQGSQYAHPANAEAIVHLDRAIAALNARAEERKARGVLGVNAK